MMFEKGGDVARVKGVRVIGGGGGSSGGLL